MKNLIILLLLLIPILVTAQTTKVRKQPNPEVLIPVKDNNGVAYYKDGSTGYRYRKICDPYTGKCRYRRMHNTAWLKF